MVEPHATRESTLLSQALGEHRVERDVSSDGCEVAPHLGEELAGLVVLYTGFEPFFDSPPLHFRENVSPREHSPPVLGWQIPSGVLEFPSRMAFAEKNIFTAVARNFTLLDLILAAPIEVGFGLAQHGEDP
jgi:hypothetical protein